MLRASRPAARARPVIPAPIMAIWGAGDIVVDWVVVVVVVVDREAGSSDAVQDKSVCSWDLS